MNEDTTKTSRALPLRCSCGTTYAQLREDGTLVIVSRHHGHKCVNELALDELLKLREEARSGQSIPKR